MSVVFKLVMILKYLPNSFELQQNLSPCIHVCDIELNHLSFFSIKDTIWLSANHLK